MKITFTGSSKLVRVIMAELFAKVPEKVEEMKKFKIVIRETFWEGLHDEEGLGKKSRNWVFTINNPNKDDEEDLENLGKNGEVKWLGFQLEVGASGTKHFQGFLHFHTPRTMGGVSKKIRRAWLAIQSGTDEQCMTYCCNKEKEGFLDGPWMIGTPASGQGKRTDLQELVKFMQTGGAISMWMVREKFPFLFLRYSKHIEAFLGTQKKNPLLKKKVELEYITEEDVEIMSKDWKEDEFMDIYVKDETKWWDDYMGENIILFRDKADIDLIKRMMKGYQIRVEKKGKNSILLHPNRIIVIKDKDTGKLRKPKINIEEDIHDIIKDSGIDLDKMIKKVLDNKKD